MGRVLLLVGLLLTLGACTHEVYPTVPGTGPGPVSPVQPPPVVPPVPPIPEPPDAPPPVDPLPEPATPEFPREALEGLTVGMTAAQVGEALNSPVTIPEGPLPTVRWRVMTDGAPHILYVVFDEAGLLRDRGLAAIITVP